MAEVVRASITNPEILGAMGEKDLANIVRKAMPVLSEQDVRRFIIRCFREGNERMGTLFVDGAVSYYLEMAGYGKRGDAEKNLGAAIATIAFYTEESAPARKKVLECLGHGDPGIAVAVIGNLPHTSNAGNFREICRLLAHGEFQVRMKALEYAEACIRDASFRKTGPVGCMGENEEDFLRKSLVELEHAYEKAKERGIADQAKKRLAILVAMAYNEILDSADCRRLQEEPIEEGIYYALEGHLHREIGPDALPLLFKMVSRNGIEEGVEKCALNTIGRIGNHEAHRGRVEKYMKNYL